MELTLLTVPDCPHLPLMEERLAQVLTDRPDVHLTRLVVTDQDQALRTGMHGSPTLLVDGVDPFAEPDQPAGMACRLYQDGPAPSAEDLRRVLSADEER